MASDPLYVLLRRALDDNGPEGQVAFEMFKKRAKDKPGQLYFLTEDYANPLYFVVQELQAENDELKREIQTLRSGYEEAGLAPKKMKVKSFPWEKYPDLEQQAFEMIFFQKRPMVEVRDFVHQHAPEADGNTTFINQKFIQNKPSPIIAPRIIVKRDGGKIDWAELWRIGTVQHSDGWIQRVMRHGGGWDKFQSNGNVPKDWARLDPNQYIPAEGRKKLREMYHSRSFPAAGDELVALVEEKGADGITEAELKSMGIGGRRLVERKKTSEIFCEGERIYHHKVAHLFPDNADAQIAVMKFHRNEIHGSEHREAVAG